MFADDPRQQVFELIGGIQVRLRRILREQLGPIGITYPQYGALDVILDRPGISQNELAEALHTDTTNVMVICSGLEKNGLVQREIDAADKRRRALQPTDSARAAMQQARGIVLELVDSLGIDPSANETIVVTRFLARVYETIGEL